MRIRCDSCEMVSINGIACHETGCPNARARYDGENWIQQYECHKCGCMVDRGEACDCQDEE